MELLMWFTGAFCGFRWGFLGRIGLQGLTFWAHGGGFGAPGHIYFASCGARLSC